jgi:hypothetical protein
MQGNCSVTAVGSALPVQTVHLASTAAAQRVVQPHACCAQRAAGALGVQPRQHLVTAVALG